MTALPTPTGNGLAPSAEAESDAGYVLGALLNRSAFSTLHLARSRADESGATTRVVRQLSSQIAGDPEMRALLRREAALGSRVQARNLVSVFATWEADPTYTAMEYVEGLSLEQLLQRGRGRPQLARLLVPAVVDALAGLAELHEVRGGQTGDMPVVHQAPVPRHIVVGLDGVARLTDLTQAIGPGFPWSQRCTDRLKPDEMAPEQALTPAHVDPRCDVFIVGTTLWRVLTGRSLFADASPEQALQKMLRMRVPSLADAGVSAGPRLDRLICMSLMRARRERLATAAEFAESLRTYAQQAGLYAERDEVAELVRGLWQARVLAAPTPIGGAELASGEIRLTHVKPALLLGRQATLLGHAPLPADVRSQLEGSLKSGKTTPEKSPPEAREQPLRGMPTQREIGVKAFALPTPSVDTAKIRVQRTARVLEPSAPAPEPARPLVASTAAVVPALDTDDSSDDLAWEHARIRAQVEAERSLALWQAPPDAVSHVPAVISHLPAQESSSFLRSSLAVREADEDEFGVENDDELPPRSRVWTVLSGVAAVVVLAAVGIGFRAAVLNGAADRLSELQDEGLSVFRSEVPAGSSNAVAGASSLPPLAEPPATAPAQDTTALPADVAPSAADLARPDAAAATDLATRDALPLAQGKPDAGIEGADSRADSRRAATAEPADARQAEPARGSDGAPPAPPVGHLPINPY